MGIIELFLIAVGLSMDAFAVSVCKGLAMKKCTWTKAGIVGLYFGIFQAGMPLLGYALGVQFSHVITSIDHWIAFVLLGIIGLNMIKESREDGEECGMEEDSLKVKEMLVLAVATSIDAFIGVTTFLLSVGGVPIGNVFGAKYKSKAELAGGLILILMGIKILLEHLGIF